MADFLVTVAGFINGYDPTVDGLRASPSNHGSFTCSCWPCAAGGQGAVFAVQDVLLFFLAWELELIPVYLLLAMGFQRDGDPPGFAYGDIAAKPLGPAFQVLCYSGLLVAFGVKLPVVPVHTPGCRQSVQSIILNVRPLREFHGSGAKLLETVKFKYPAGRGSRLKRGTVLDASICRADIEEELHRGA